MMTKLIITFLLAVLPAFLCAQIVSEDEEEEDHVSYTGRIIVDCFDYSVDTIFLNHQFINDTLYIYRKWREYQTGFGPGMTCAVFGCQSDHIIEKRDRLVFWHGRFIRREYAKPEQVPVKKEITEYETIWKWE